MSTLPNWFGHCLVDRASSSSVSQSSLVNQNTTWNSIYSMSGMTQISDQNCPICPDRICFLPEEGDAFISKTAELTKCWTTKAEWRRLERAFPPIFLRMRTDRTDRTSALAIWQLYYRHHLSNMTGNSIIMSNRSDFIKGHFSSNTFQEFTSATKSSILPRAHRIRVIRHYSHLKPR